MCLIQWDDSGTKWCFVLCFVHSTWYYWLANNEVNVVFFLSLLYKHVIIEHWKWLMRWENQNIIWYDRPFWPKFCAIGISVCWTFFLSFCVFFNFNQVSYMRMKILRLLNRSANDYNLCGVLFIALKKTDSKLPCSVQADYKHNYEYIGYIKIEERNQMWTLNSTSDVSNN